MEEDKFRPMVAFIKEREGGKPLVGVEIGASKGRHALTILENLNMKMLYLIDPYNTIDNYYGSVRAREFLVEIKRKIMQEFSNTELIIKTSIDALPLIPENVDFVYVDGSHEYKDVDFDVNNYINKVKIGGVFGGHDYTSPIYPGVKNVVDKFISRTGYKLYTKWTTFPSVGKAETDWWVVKE